MIFNFICSNITEVCDETEFLLVIIRVSKSDIYNYIPLIRLILFTGTNFSRF